MVKAYDSVDLTVIEYNIDSRKLRQNTEETRIDDYKLDAWKLESKFKKGKISQSL